MSTDTTAPVPPADRHPLTVHLMRQFRSDHLPPSLREVSERCQHVAQLMLRDFPDGPELTAGLRMLLLAKDCFVRHAVDTAAERRGAAELVARAESAVSMFGASDPDECC